MWTNMNALYFQQLRRAYNVRRTYYISRKYLPVLDNVDDEQVVHKNKLSHLWSRECVECFKTNNAIASIYRGRDMIQLDKYTKHTSWPTGKKNFSYFVSFILNNVRVLAVYYSDVTFPNIVERWLWLLTPVINPTTWTE